MALRFKGAALEPVAPSLYRVRISARTRDSSTTMKRLRTCLAALLYTASAAFASGLPQAADSPAGRPESADATTYIQWLEERSMLHQAQVLAQRYSGNAVQWHHPYGQPQPRAAVSRASVWFTAYPASTIAGCGALSRRSGSRASTPDP